MRVRACIIAPICLAFSQLAFGNACYSIPVRALELVSRNPEREAEIEAQKASPLLLGVARYALETPGARGEPYCWSQAHKVHVIEGTSDYTCNDETLQFNGRAWSFAERFNRRLIQLSAVLQRHPCAA